MSEMVTITPLGKPLPRGWRLESLGSMCLKIGSGATPKGGSSVYVDKGISFIRSQNVLDHKFSKAGLAFIDDEAAQRLANVAVKSRDVLLNITGDGDTIAQSCVVPDDVLPARVNQHVVIIRTGMPLVPEYLQRYLSHPSIREYMLSHNSGGSRRAITKGNIERFEIVVPPLSVQTAITEVLGALDDKIAINERIVETALALGDAQYVCMAAVSTGMRGKLGELAKTGHLEFGDGYRTKRSEHGRPGLPILRVAEVLDARIEPSFADFVHEGYRPAMGVKVSRPGDVVLTTKGTVGRVVLMPSSAPEFVYSPQLCFFRTKPSSPFRGAYFYFWLRSRDFWCQAGTLKSQTDMADYLSLRDIRTLEIPIPDMKAQGAMADILGALLSRIAACRDENQTLSKLRDTLLPKLISGELRVRDAERAVEQAV